MRTRSSSRRSRRSTACKATLLWIYTDAMNQSTGGTEQTTSMRSIRNCWRERPGRDHSGRDADRSYIEKAFLSRDRFRCGRRGGSPADTSARLPLRTTGDSMRCRREQTAARGCKRSGRRTFDSLPLLRWVRTNRRICGQLSNAAFSYQTLAEVLLKY